ncbi:MAG: serine hydrolase domain-containing protein [Bacteroidota bacterium]
MYRLAFIALFLIGCQQPSQQDSHLESIARIEQALKPHVIIRDQAPTPASINDRLAHYNVPGVSIAVMLEGELAWARGYGMADSASGQAVTDQTLFQAASISKPVAAMAALEMIENEQLSLDGDINSYLSSWQLPGEGFTDAEKVNIRRLLNHTAGTTVWGFPGYARSEERISTKDVLTGDGNTDAIVVYKEPGESWRYSGGGYTVMQLAMEDVAERDFASLTEALVLQPLGMTSSTYSQPLKEAWHERAATGYRGSGEIVEMNWHVYPEQAAAGLWTTPSDLLKYAASVQRSYAGSEEEILLPATVQEMLTPGMDNHGLGPSISEDGLYFQHGGANEGFRCFLSASIKEGYGVVIMTNSDNGSDLSREIRYAIAEEYGWPGHERDIRDIVELSDDQIAVLTGNYAFEEWGPVQIVIEEEGLFAVGGPLSEPALLLAESPTQLFDATEGVRFEFDIQEDEAVSFTVVGRTATRVE